MKTIAASLKNERKAELKSKIWKQLVDSRYLIMLILPGLAYFILFHYVPMYGIQIAFKDFRLGKGIMGSEWVGIDNFLMLTKSSDFLNVMKNTLILSFYRLVIVFPIPIIFALMLNEIRNIIYKKITQTIIYLPHFISWVVAGGLFINFLSPETGLINDIIKLFGGDAIYFMIEPKYFRSILVISSIWKGAGWGTIIYLAALAGVDLETYEAAIIDGATKFQRIIHITIPSIMNVVVIMFILQIGAILNSDFEQVLNLYNPLVFNVGDVLDTYAYRIGLGSTGKNQYSFAAAVGLFKSIVGFFLIVMTNKIASKMSEGEMRIW